MNWCRYPKEIRDWGISHQRIICHRQNVYVFVLLMSYIYQTRFTLKDQISTEKIYTNVQTSKVPEKENRLLYHQLFLTKHSPVLQRKTVSFLVQGFLQTKANTKNETYCYSYILLFLFRHFGHPYHALQFIGNEKSSKSKIKLIHLAITFIA